jgi:hypothetical protein
MLLWRQHVSYDARTGILPAVEMNYMFERRIVITPKVWMAVASIFGRATPIPTLV